MSADRDARLGETVRSLGALSTAGLSFVRNVFKASAIDQAPPRRGA